MRSPKNAAPPGWAIPAAARNNINRLQSSAKPDGCQVLDPSLLADVADVAHAAAIDAWQAAQHFASEALRHARARDEALNMLVAAEASIPMEVRHGN